MYVDIYMRSNIVPLIAGSTRTQISTLNVIKIYKYNKSILNIASSPVEVTGHESGCERNFDWNGHHPITGIVV